MPRKPKPVAREVVELLLISRSMLDRMRAQTSANPDRHSVAINVLLGHDASELVLAAIANHHSVSPSANRNYLMDYFAAIKSIHPTTEVYGHGYFDQLNRVRNNLKHKGIFPDVHQWAHVVEKVYEYTSAWCSKYLKLSLDNLDHSVLLQDETAKGHYEQAKTYMSSRRYKEVLEELAWTLSAVFETKPALSGISIGHSSAEDAIRLAAFGVQANDFITLQQFLPRIVPGKPVKRLIWKQDQYGHPGNWHEEPARFCLTTVLDVAIKLQAAGWIPDPVPFQAIYEYEVEAIGNDVEVWNLPKGEQYSYGLTGERVERKLVTKLAQGQKFRAMMVLYERKKQGLTMLMGEMQAGGEEIHLLASDFSKGGYVPASQVKIKCVPKDTPLRRKYYPDLPELEWRPES